MAGVQWLGEIRKGPSPEEKQFQQSYGLKQQQLGLQGRELAGNEKKAILNAIIESIKLMDPVSAKAFLSDPQTQQQFKEFGMPIPYGVSGIQEKQYEMDTLSKLLGGQQTTTQGITPRLKSLNIGNATLDFPQTEQEFQTETRRKAEEQSRIATEKERQLNISKISRLSNIADTVETKFLETKPHSGKLVALQGAIDIMASTLQASPEQITDKAYRDFLKGMRAQLARAMGDVGNLSEPEQKAAMNLMPSLWDSKETGLLKLKNLRDLIETIRQKSTGLSNELSSKVGTQNETDSEYQKYLQAIGE